MGLPQVIVGCLADRGIRPMAVERVQGGDIHTAVLLRTSEDKRYFLKYSRGEEAEHLLLTEFRSLQYLAKATGQPASEVEQVLVPEPLAVERVEEFTYLLLPYIVSGLRTKAFWEKFGRALAQLHSLSADAYGFPFDNYIGRLPQSNKRHENWIDFYVQERLLPQLHSALSADLLSLEDMKRMDKLIDSLPGILPEEKPALVHGDLWSGNFLCDKQQRAWLIDPAPYYAHREMDWAMSKLFGGFDSRFYSAYQEVFPLLPGYGERIKFYQLYYLLVHLNLFGKAYYASIRAIW